MAKKLYPKTCPICLAQFEHQDRRQKYCSRDCYNQKLKGEGNPFYGKVHNESTIEILKKKCGQPGKSNPFYGKQHSDETKDKLSSSSKRYFQQNKDKILDRVLNIKNVELKDLMDQWENYRKGNYPLNIVSKILGIDKRTVRDNWLRYKICTLEEYKTATDYQKLGKNSSSCEDKLYKKLLEHYGPDDIIRQFYHKGYYFDFLLLGKYIIEYDGYYFHKILESNDEMKTKLIENSRYTLIRIEEPENRKTDFEEAIEYINEICSNTEKED